MRTYKFYTLALALSGALLFSPIAVLGQAGGGGAGAGGAAGAGASGAAASGGGATTGAAAANANAAPARSADGTGGVTTGAGAPAAAGAGAYNQGQGGFGPGAQQAPNQQSPNQRLNRGQQPGQPLGIDSTGAQGAQRANQQGANQQGDQNRAGNAYNQRGDQQSQFNTQRQRQNEFGTRNFSGNRNANDLNDQGVNRQGRSRFNRTTPSTGERQLDTSTQGRSQRFRGTQPFDGGGSFNDSRQSRQRASFDDRRFNDDVNQDFDNNRDDVLDNDYGDTVDRNRRSDRDSGNYVDLEERNQQAREERAVRERELQRQTRGNSGLAPPVDPGGQQETFGADTFGDRSDDGFNADRFDDRFDSRRGVNAGREGVNNPFDALPDDPRAQVGGDARFDRSGVDARSRSRFDANTAREFRRGDSRFDRFDDRFDDRRFDSRNLDRSPSGFRDNRREFNDLPSRTSDRFRQRSVPDSTIDRGTSSNDPFFFDEFEF